MNFFGKPDPKVEMRANQRELRKTNRELESDRRAMERREKELEVEIKKLAAKGHLDAAKSLARQLVQLRNQKTKSIGMSSKITGVQAQQSQMQSMAKMGQAMGQTVKTMKAMDRQMPMDKVMRNMREFQAAQEKMCLTEEMMNDSLDAMFDEPGDEAEQNAIVNQVLDEIGIDMNAKMAAVPSVPTSSNKMATFDDLEQQLAKLRS